MKAGAEEAIRFIERTIANIDIPIQEISFLELTAPNMEEGMAKCVERGATEIAVVPILLLTAHHANEDIPIKIEKGKRMYPEIKFKYGKALGIHPKIIDSLLDRVIEQKVDIEENAQVLLVGRGSSDPAVKRDLIEIAQLLNNTFPFSKVDVCFLYGAKPSFNEALQQLQRAEQRQVFIIPYLLFTGILMNGIIKKLEEKPASKHRFILCKTLGYHPNIQEVLEERVYELFEKEEMLTSI